MGEGTVVSNFLNVSVRLTWVLSFTPSYPGAQCVGSWVAPCPVCKWRRENE